MNRLAPLAVAIAASVAPRLAAAQSGDGAGVHVHVDVHAPGVTIAVPPPDPGAPPVHVRPGPPRAERPGPVEPVYPAPPPRHPERFDVPPDRVPGHGQCRIWYDDLPPDRQPPPMRCDRAHHLARRHGGRVIWPSSRHGHRDGHVESASYGHADFRGVPPDRLPPPGACRVWLEGVPPDRQPPPGPCERARHDAARTGGRLLYMPGP